MYSCPIKIQIKQEWDNTTRVSNLYMTTGAVPFQMIAYTFVPKWCIGNVKVHITYYYKSVPF